MERHPPLACEPLARRVDCGMDDGTKQREGQGNEITGGTGDGEDDQTMRDDEDDDEKRGRTTTTTGRRGRTTTTTTTTMTTTTTTTTTVRTARTGQPSTRPCYCEQLLAGGKAGASDGEGARRR